jgi:hypothetical protein
MKILGLRKSVSLNHRMLIVGIGPTKICPYHDPSYLDEGPCNMGESQHEPTI